MQITVDLGPELEAYVREQVECGRYRSIDEMIEAALLLLEDALLVCEHHDRGLQQAVREGRDTYLDLPIKEARLRNRARFIALGARLPGD
jgi:putative addiction module CopG family antidote